MKIPLKTIIAFWWWKKFRFNKPANNIQKITNTGKGIRSLFLILPRDSNYLRLAQHFLKTISTRGEINAINKIIGWEEQKDIIDKIYLQRAQLINESDINKYGLLVDSSLKQLTNGKFNCVVNLDPNTNPISYQIVSSFDSIPRIGFSSDIDKNVYNITIDSKNGTNYIEQGYEYIIEALGL